MEMRMSRTESPRSIVVGIDGSASAVLAAQWAADEAVSQDRILRLVHVIEPGSEAVRLEEEYAQIALTTAHSAVETLNVGLRVELAVRRGGIGAVLVEESRYAARICIGHAVGDFSVDPRGDDSTTVALARWAGCRLAVIGRDCAGPRRHRSIRT
jgi:nucleotide-binding universal stress UspA family protein